MKKYETIKIDFLGLKVKFFTSKKSYDKYCKKKSYIDYEIIGTGVTNTISDSEGTLIEILIAVYAENNECEDKAVLVHEASHAVTDIFEYFCFDCDELRSYLLGYIYKKAIKFYNKQVGV
jgi:hypothetical protein